MNLAERLRAALDGTSAETIGADVPHLLDAEVVTPAAVHASATTSAISVRP